MLLAPLYVACACCTPTMLCLTDPWPPSCMLLLQAFNLFDTGESQYSRHFPFLLHRMCCVRWVGLLVCMDEWMHWVAGSLAPHSPIAAVSNLLTQRGGDPSCAPHRRIRNHRCKGAQGRHACPGL